MLPYRRLVGREIHAERLVCRHERFEPLRLSAELGECGIRVRGRSGQLLDGQAADARQVAFDQSIRLNRREFVFRYRSPSHWLSVFRTFYGPMSQAFAALDAPDQARLTRDLLALVDRHNRSGDRTLVLPSKYLEAIVDRRAERVAGHRGRALRAVNRGVHEG